MPPIITTAEIGRPAAEVFAYATDPALFVHVEPVTDSRSRLTISVDFTGHGIGKILVPLMVRREARKEMPGNMSALKQKLEAV
ncbi:MAG: hypothetical protein ACRDRJ_23440 [Streptosporangiaceae bacterium]